MVILYLIEYPIVIPNSMFRQFKLKYDVIENVITEVKRTD